MRWQDHKQLTIYTNGITAGNTVKKVGAMIWLNAEASNPQKFVDLSENRLHARFTGNIYPSFPEAARGPYILPNAGDADATVTINHYPVTVLPYSTTLTTNRTVTLPSITDRPTVGQRIRVVRTGLGGYTIDVGGVVTLPVSIATTVELEWSGSAWVTVSYASPTLLTKWDDLMVPGTTIKTGATAPAFGNFGAKHTSSILVSTKYS